MDLNDLRIDARRLLTRIDRLAEIGAIEDGGVCRLALSEEDKAGRDLVTRWMRELGLEVSVDQIGNVVGVRAGRQSGAPVMTGSHIDTVRTGGRYDGNLGVLAGLEVIEVLTQAGVETEHPLAVAFFTNEEGSRFAPDMMGSLVFVGGMEVSAAHGVVGIDGRRVGDCLAQIGYLGDQPCGQTAVRAHVELHIEQGPILEAENLTIGAVEGVQGISWTEYTVTGVSNHAGTTPMRMRHDAGYVAAALACEVRNIAADMRGDQVGTVGAIDLRPNLVNVVPNQAVVTVDLRNTDELLLQEAETRLDKFVDELSARESVHVESRRLARFEPVSFDEAIIAAVESTAHALGYSTRRMPSGAGHDAQMLARICPTGMIFVPSVGGISHNVREHTSPEDIEAGANVLLQMLVKLANA